jgi:hypothetical protein
MRRLVFGFVLVFAIVVVFFACSTSDDDIPSGKGRLEVYMTDAPFPIDLISSTAVTIDRVDIKKQETDTTESSFIVISEDTMEINLLELTNGITELIASADLDVGTYDMIRLHIAGSKIILKDESEFDLEIPSGSSSGLKIKIKPAIEILEGQTTDVLLDFDVSRSFVVKGNWKGGKINGFNFKPVVRGVLVGNAGRIVGVVKDTADVVLEDASIKVWADSDSLVTSGFSSDAGTYKILGLLEGTYFLTAEKEGYKTDSVENVSVVSGNITEVNFELVPEEGNTTE